MSIHIHSLETPEERKERFERMLAPSKGLSPLPMSVAYPCDEDSLKGALMARDRGLMDPILVGPGDRIRDVAERSLLDLHGCTMVESEGLLTSAFDAVALVREKKAAILMKGALHTDEIMREVVVRDTGLRTDRRISHVFVMSVPTCERTLYITDAAVNMDPNLEDKVHIVQSAIEVAHMMGNTSPKVAILAAVETINPRMQATLDAAALCKMADRGQIRGGILDGPLAFDNAISERAAQNKKIVSPVAGLADILVAPNLEAGNMIAKQLEYLACAVSAGIILGAKVPIVLTSRADTAETRLASAAVALVLAHRKLVL